MQGSLQIANFFQVTEGGGLCVWFIQSAAGSKERKGAWAGEQPSGGCGYRLPSSVEVNAITLKGVSI